MCPLRSLLGAAAALLLPMLVPPAAPAAAEEGLQHRSEALIASLNAFWTWQIATLGGRYRAPQVSYFTQPLTGQCAVRAALSGTFYCPVDETVYIDVPDAEQIVQGSRTDARLSLGYVLAHQLSHHIQNIIGTTALVDQARARSTLALANRKLTALELQADCYAGLWIHWAEAHGELKAQPDIASALDTVAAAAKQWSAHLAAGQQMLDPMTHGAAAQRLKWIQQGAMNGQFNDCDTFAADATGHL